MDLVNRHSDFQHIRLVETDEGMTLFLDDYWQLSEQEEPVYHETIALAPFLMIPAGLPALILGGGDGLAARELIRAGVSKVDLVEIDPAVVELSNNEMARISRRALKSGIVNVQIGDARKFILDECTKRYGLIIADFPSEVDDSPDHMGGLLNEQMVRAFREHLTEQGVVTTQVSLADYDQAVVLEHFNKHFRNVKVVTVGYSTGDDEEILFASDAPLTFKREIPSWARFLTEDVARAIAETPNVDRLVIECQKRLSYKQA